MKCMWPELFNIIAANSVTDDEILFVLVRAKQAKPSLTNIYKEKSGGGGAVEREEEENSM